jgi:type IV pilus assembly protein PilM
VEVGDPSSFRGGPAASTIRGSDVIVRRLTIPVMKRSDLLKALSIECRKHVPYPIHEAEIRYEVLSSGDGPASRAAEILVAVAPRRAVLEARESLERAGLRPVCLTIRPVALRCLLRSAGSEARAEVVAYLDMGAEESHIMVFRGDEIRFTRQVGIGTASLTEALRAIVVPGQGTVDLSADEAAALLRACGIPTGSEEGARAGRIPLSAVSVMLRPILERLVRELWNSFDYCNEQYQGESVSRVVLLGPGGAVSNLGAYLADVLKIPVGRADLSERVSVSPAPDADPASEVAVGLSLLLPGSMNFLEPAGAGVPYRVAEAVPQPVAAVAAAALLLSTALPAEVGVIRERQRVASLRAEASALESRSAEVERFRLARTEEARIEDLLGRLSAGRVVWSEVLRDLGHRLGPNARLLAFEVAEPKRGSDAAAAPGADGAAVPREARLTGLIRTGGQRPEKLLGELMASLESAPQLAGVRLLGWRMVEPELGSFTLSASLAE